MDYKGDLAGTPVRMAQAGHPDTANLLKFGWQATSVPD
jgi:hypothetical protein